MARIVGPVSVTFPLDRIRPDVFQQKVNDGIMNWIERGKVYPILKATVWQARKHQVLSLTWSEDGHIHRMPIKNPVIEDLGHDEYRIEDRYFQYGGPVFICPGCAECQAYSER